MHPIRVRARWVIACLVVPTAVVAQPSPPSPPLGDPAEESNQSNASANTSRSAPANAAVPGQPPVTDSPPDPANESAWEPDPALVDYVSASTKLTEPARRSPSSVWVISRHQIALAGYQSVAEALSEVPGLYVSYDLDNYNVALRGLYGGARAGSRYLKVMIDSRPISFTESGVSYLGPEFIPIAAVERIEVVRGPVSSLYGAGALVGAINIVTRRPAYEGELATKTIFEVGGSALGARGAFGQGVQMVIAKRTFALLAVSAGYLDRSGLEVPGGTPFHDKFVDPTGVAMTTKNDKTRPLSLLGRVEQYAFGGRFSGLFAAQLHDAQNEFHDLAILSHATRSSLYTAGISASFERPTPSGLTLVTSAGIWTGGPRQGERFDLGDPGFTIKRDYGYRLIEGSAELRYDRDNGGWLLVGIDGQHDQEQLISISEVDRTTGARRIRTTGGQATLMNVAGYAQALIPIHDKLRFAANIRWDQQNIYGGALSARAALVAPVLPRLTLKLMGGRSYKPPSPEQLFGVGVSLLDVSGKRDAPPQYLNGVEGLIDLFLTRQLGLNLGAYYQRYTDTLAYLRIGTGLSAQPFDADSFGIEASLRSRVELGPLDVDGVAGVTAQQLVTASRTLGGVTDKPVPDNEGVPTLMANVRISVLGPRGAGGQVRLRYAGARTPSQSNLLLDGGTLDMTMPSYMLAAYTLVDLAVAAPDVELEGKSTLKLRGGVNNALDKRYAEIGFNGVDIPSLGRTVWASATTSF